MIANTGSAARIAYNVDKLSSLEGIASEAEA
jgi:hypothetical protein